MWAKKVRPQTLMTIILSNLNRFKKNNFFTGIFPATAIGNVHKNFCDDRTCGSEDIVADKYTQRHTQRQTDTLSTILRSPIGAEQQASTQADFYTVFQEKQNIKLVTA